MAFNWKKILRS